MLRILQDKGGVVESVLPVHRPECLIKNNVWVDSHFEKSCSCGVTMQELDKLNKHSIGPWLDGLSQGSLLVFLKVCINNLHFEFIYNNNT